MYEQVVQCGVDLVLDVAAAVLLAILDGRVDQLRVLLLLGGSEDEGRVGGGILGLVLGDGRKVTRVANDNLRKTVNKRSMVFTDAGSPVTSPGAPMQ